MVVSSRSYLLNKTHFFSEFFFLTSHFCNASFCLRFLKGVRTLFSP